ncbi:MAG: hypothetical protein ABSG46_20460 [Candidatus Binataceae bacterium]|jgi:hypothetical protein
MDSLEPHELDEAAEVANDTGHMSGWAALALEYCSKNGFEGFKAWMEEPLGDESPEQYAYRMEIAGGIYREGLRGIAIQYANQSLAMQVTHRELHDQANNIRRRMS